MPSGYALDDAMWIRLTFTKLAPVDMDDARKLYQSPFVSGVIKQQKGYRFHYWLESKDSPGEAISLTAWDCQADAEAYERSGVYTEVGDRLRRWFKARSLLRSFEVLEPADADPA